MKSFNVFRKRPLPQDPRDPKARNRRELQNREDRSQEQGNRLAEILDLNRGGQGHQGQVRWRSAQRGLTQSPCPDPDRISDEPCRQVEFLATPAI